MTGQQLKNSILQMAVQGKLVPQDPNDEPASVLLERIRAEKEQLIKEGKIKREKNPSRIFRGADNLPYEQVGKNKPVCIADEVPFEIPDSWEWVRIKNYCLDVFSGKSPKYEKTPTEFRIIGQAANQQDGIDYTNIKYTNSEFWKSMPEKYFLQKNDVLLNTLGNGTLGRSGIINELPYNLLTDGHLFVFRNINATTSIYFYYYLQTKKEEIIKSANGSTNQTFLNLKNTLDWVLPIPPLNEQIRIIEKLNEVLLTIKKYAKKEVLINNLNMTFPKLLKKSILQQAVMGKLVPQDENDEPASVLLERIRAEKQKLIAEGKIKKDKNESVIFKRDNSHYEKLNGIERCIDDEIPFDIPESWAWCRLGNIGDWGSGATPSRSHPEYYDGNIPWLKTGDLNDGYIDNVPEFISEKALAETSVRLNSIGSVLIAMYGATIGKIGILNIEATTNQACCACLPLELYNKYLFYYLMSQKSSFIKRGEGGAQPNISKEKIVSTLMPLPPLEEQYRIVSKIEQLLGITKML